MASSKILLILLITALVNCESGETTISDENETTLATTSTSSTSTLSTTTTKVPDRPIKAPGCYWTECKSPLTYSLKCPPDTQEQNENDEMPCEGIFVKYQCCPREEEEKTVIGTGTATPIIDKVEKKKERPVNTVIIIPQD